MTIKERLRQLVDDLSDAEANDAFEYIASQREIQDRPGDMVDEWGNLSAMSRASSRRMLKRLDEAEMAEHGETIAETFARAERKGSR
jgi:hypothetical protein